MCFGADLHVVFPLLSACRYHGGEEAVQQLDHGERRHHPPHCHGTRAAENAADGCESGAEAAAEVRLVSSV